MATATLDKDSKPGFATEHREFEHRDIEETKDAKAFEVVDQDARGYVDPSITITEEESAAMRWRVHKRILPLMCLAYLGQVLDKGTLGTASIMGWIDDVGAKGQDYALTNTVLWCGIILGEPVANQCVRRLPLGKLLAGGICIWSILLMGLTFSLSIGPVLAIRFLLGFFESLVGPCLLAITVQWYLKEEQPPVTAAWQAMIGLNYIIGGLLGFGFYHLKFHGYGLRGWQYMHLVISLGSFAISLAVLLFMPDSPTRARWLTKEERVKFVERVRPNNQGLKQKVWRSEQAWEAAKDPLTYLLFLMSCFQCMIVGGIGTFANLLINKAFGFSVEESQLLNIPIGVMSLLMYALMGWLISKTKQTLLCIIIFCIPNIIGTITLITVAPSPATRAGLIVAFYCMQCLQACNPPIFLTLSRNVAGQTKKSIVYAVTYIGWASGNAISPQIFQSKWAPRYINSLYIHLGIYTCLIITVLVTRWMLVRRNRKREEAQNNVPPANELAFEDLTDLANPDFRYTI